MMPMVPYLWFMVPELFWTLTDLVGSFRQNTKSVPYIAVMVQPNKPVGNTADPFVVLKAAIKVLMPYKPATNLKTPTPEWTTYDQYDEFKLL